MILSIQWSDFARFQYKWYYLFCLFFIHVFDYYNALIAWLRTLYQIYRLGGITRSGSWTFLHASLPDLNKKITVSCFDWRGKFIGKLNLHYALLQNTLVNAYPNSSYLVISSFIHNLKCELLFINKIWLSIDETVVKVTFKKRIFGLTTKEKNYKNWKLLVMFITEASSHRFISQNHIGQESLSNMRKNHTKRQVIDGTEIWTAEQFLGSTENNCIIWVRVNSFQHVTRVSWSCHLALLYTKRLLLNEIQRTKKTTVLRSLKIYKYIILVWLKDSGRLTSFISTLQGLYFFSALFALSMVALCLCCCVVGCSHFMDCLGDGRRSLVNFFLKWSLSHVRKKKESDFYMPQRESEKCFFYYKGKYGHLLFTQVRLFCTRRVLAWSKICWTGFR